MAVREILHTTVTRVAGFAETVVGHVPGALRTVRDVGIDALRTTVVLAPDIAVELQQNGWPEHWRKQAPNAGRLAGAAMYIGAEVVDVLAPPVGPTQRDTMR